MSYKVLFKYWETTDVNKEICKIITYWFLLGIPLTLLIDKMRLSTERYFIYN